MKNSAEYYDTYDKISTYKMAKVFESQISNGRKIFRLFLWLNEIEEIQNIIRSEKLTLNLKILKIISTICSFIYYFSDNLVWFAKIGFISKFLPFSKRFYGTQVKWNSIKDIFSLAKTMLELFVYIYTYILKMQEDK